MESSVIAKELFYAFFIHWFG